LSRSTTPPPPPASSSCAGRRWTGHPFAL
jgi:hypothetical protein